MKKKMQSIHVHSQNRGNAGRPPLPRSARNMLKASDTVIKIHGGGHWTLDEMLAAVMLEAAARGWGEDWKFVSPIVGGISYYGVRNPIKQENRKSKNKKA
jgi:hypothetical protein